MSLHSYCFSLMGVEAVLLVVQIRAVVHIRAVPVCFMMCTYTVNVVQNTSVVCYNAALCVCGCVRGWRAYVLNILVCVCACALNVLVNVHVWERA